MANPPNPCLSCGVCCTMFRVSFYWGESNLTTPGGVPVEMTDRLGPHRLMMKGTGGSNPRCVALEGELCKQVFCSIHPNRPSVCRAFDASWVNGVQNERCDQARARFGLPPLKPEDWISPDDNNDGDLPPIAPAA